MVQMPKSAHRPIESVRSLVWAAEAKARGYRSLRNPMAIAHRTAGLKFKSATCDSQETMGWHCQEMRLVGRCIKNDA